MSGGFGWKKDDDHLSRGNSDSSFSYTPPTSSIKKAVAPPRSPPPTSVATSIKKGIQVSAKNLVVVSIDMTGSMSAWADEILKRLSTLYVATTTFLGDDLEMVFMGFGDPGRCGGDNFIVPGIGRGSVLEDMLDDIRPFSQRGGGNQRENAELGLLFADRLITSTGVRNAFFFTITDEMAYDNVDPNVAFRCGIAGAQPEPFADLLARVSSHYHVMTIFADTQSYGNLHQSTFLPWWQGHLHDRVIPLDDGRRVVEVILGAIAKTVHQYDVFSSMLQNFQGGTKYGPQNIATVHRSLSLLGSRDPVPPAKSKIGLMGEDS